MNFKKYLIIVAVFVLIITSCGAVWPSEPKINSNSVEVKTVEIIPKTPAPNEFTVKPTKTEAPKPTPEPKFFYSNSIRVLVDKTEKNKIEALLLGYEEEIKMIAKVIYREARRSSIPLEQKAAVAWVILNRVDSDGWKDTIEGVIKSPNQFAWVNKTPLDWEWLARDIVTRWLLEKEGHALVGRTIPPDYFFFAGHNGKNRFRKTYKSRTYWDWSLPDPYEELPYPDNLSVIIDMFAEEQKTLPQTPTNLKEN